MQSIAIAGLAWLALAYLIPTPPSKITIATSLAGDHYQVLGTRYQGILAGSSVELELQITDGAKENLRLLNDPTSGVQVGFMQGGISSGKLAPDLLSLGRIDYQIFWLFYPTGETADRSQSAQGKAHRLGDRSIAAIARFAKKFSPRPASIMTTPLCCILRLEKRPKRLMMGRLMPFS